jgi:hypothetical protein
VRLIAASHDGRTVQLARVAKQGVQAMNHQTSILTDDELDAVRGADDNYHYCSVGPAGAGSYPTYVPCSNPFIDAIVAGVIKGASAGSQK